MSADASGKSFEMTISVDAADIDALGHVNNAVYIRWIQDVAVAHWQVLAPPQVQAEVLWVVLRHEIDYKQPAFQQDVIILRTWVGVAEGLRFDRFTEILRAPDRKVLAQARTVWVPIDPKTNRPRRVSAELRTLFSA
jgi:acyl-CoA thioester hydrolase